MAITFSGFESPACGISSYEWALGSEPGWSDILPFSSVGIVMLNESNGHAQAHLQVHHGQIIYASVRAHTGTTLSLLILQFLSQEKTMAYMISFPMGHICYMSPARLDCFQKAALIPNDYFRNDDVYDIVMILSI